MDGFRIRPAGADDLPLLAAVLGAVRTGCGAPAALAEPQAIERELAPLLDPARGALWTFVGKGAVCGLLSVALDAQGGVELRHLALAPAWRRLGLGGVLVETALRWAEERKRKPLWVALPAYAVSAEPILAALGFVEGRPSARRVVPPGSRYLERA